MFILLSDDKCQGEWHLISQDSFGHIEAFLQCYGLIPYSMNLFWLPLPTHEEDVLHRKELLNKKRSEPLLAKKVISMLICFKEKG